MPFIKEITISNLPADGYVMLDILPAGRSSIMLTRIVVLSFSKSEGGWIAPFFVADDDTETRMIALIDSIENKEFDVLVSMEDMSTKNSIKNIKFKARGSGTVSATLNCYGYIF